MCSRNQDHIPAGAVLKSVANRFFENGDFEMKTMHMAELGFLAGELAYRFSQMSEGQLAQQIDWVDYHGFLKARLREDMLRAALDGSGYSPEDVQAEVVWVNSDLSDQVHYHEQSAAYVVVLTERHHVESPWAAEMYDGERWVPLRTPRDIQIPAGKPHGFRIRPGATGILYFLSVQSPPIVGSDGHDDYHKVEGQGG